MKSKTFYLFLIISLSGCHKEVIEKQLNDLAENEFLIVPGQPCIIDDVFMVSVGCSYNMLASVNVSSHIIFVKKRFNSQMKWPCVLKFDTIPLGRLNKGTYNVVLQIVDTNPSVNDSIFSEEKQTIKVVE